MALKLPDDPFGPRYVGHGPSNESEETSKAKFHAWLKANGQGDLYYELYPLERPEGWESKATREEGRSRGRGGRGGR